MIKRNNSESKLVCYLATRFIILLLQIFNCSKVQVGTEQEKSPFVCQKVIIVVIGTNSLLEESQ